MSRPRFIHEAATEYGMSIEDFADTAMYRDGVAAGSIVEWVRSNEEPSIVVAPDEPAETPPAKKHPRR